MTNNNNLINLWKIVAADKTTGLVKRLYSRGDSHPIYATFRYPSNSYGIAFSFGSKVNIDISNFQNLKGFKVLLLNDTSFEDSKLLVVELQDPSNKDVFASLCEDLIQTVAPLDSQNKVAKTVINQLARWKKLFERSSSEGLSTSEQQGLYGELQFLQKCLSQKQANPYNVIKSWVGPEANLRDFQGPTWAVEVKTTSKNDTSVASISNEHQLDESLIEMLFLFHCAVEVSLGNGETLNQKISAIRQTLNDNVPALYLFNLKLFEVGYFDQHASKYESRHYKIRSESFYHITKDFPRIKANELRNGVSEVKYNISLAMCDEYTTTENQLFNKIQNI